MKKQILNLGKGLNKAEQKSINGGGSRCNEYNGPISYGPSDCEAFHALPSYFKTCVFVHSDCFDNEMPF